MFKDRVVLIKKFNKKGKYILYWMQGAFRTDYNHSLEFAIYLSNQKRIPLLVLIILDLTYPEANYRSFKFFCQGLKEIIQNLTSRKIGVHLRLGKFEEIVPSYREAEVLIVDRAYLPSLRKKRKTIYQKLKSSIYEVDTNLVVPVHLASPKMERGAFSFRPKINKLVSKFLNDFREFSYKEANLGLMKDFEIEDYEKILKQRVVFLKPVDIEGGRQGAISVLKKFIKEKFWQYKKMRNDPTKEIESNLSAYLHFGHISPIEIIKSLPKDSENFEAFFEQLVVRRELAHNFTFYAKTLKKFDIYLPAWAKNSLIKHLKDKREYLYSLSDFEKANTHDPYWNSAQKQLIATGKIHNYMRMYWGKKIIEWSKDFDTAYKVMVHLNNKYALDGRDPNSYAGILWCFGLHDRPFFEREIFGKVRYMSESGLKRKFEIEKYVTKWGKII